MSNAEFYPYAVAGDALRLECTVDRDDAVVEDGRILLQGVPEGKTVKVDLDLHVAEGTLDRVLPEDEIADPPVIALAVLKGLPARTRGATQLTRDGEHRWSGTLDLPKPITFQSLELEPVIARKRAGTPQQGLANHLGARLAWGRSVLIQADDAPVPPGGYLEVQWDNFSTSGSPERKKNPGLLYMLDTDRDPPMLWLNSGIEHFKAVAHARGPRGRNIRIRDAVFEGIVGQVWTSLVSIVIVKLAAAMSSEPDADSALETLGEWETRVVHHWAPKMLPEAGSGGEAIREFAEHAGTADLVSGLQDRLCATVQEQARGAYAFQGLIRLRDNEGV